MGLIWFLVGTFAVVAQLVEHFHGNKQVYVYFMETVEK
jgi:hypothetical protein